MEELLKVELGSRSRNSNLLGACFFCRQHRSVFLVCSCFLVCNLQRTFIFNQNCLGCRESSCTEKSWVSLKLKGTSGWALSILEEGSEPDMYQLSPQKRHTETKHLQNSMHNPWDEAFSNASDGTGKGSESYACSQLSDGFLWSASKLHLLGGWLDFFLFCCCSVWWIHDLIQLIIAWLRLKTLSARSATWKDV